MDMNVFESAGVSKNACRIGPSITHGAKAMVDEMNQSLAEDEKVIDLSIGNLDLPTDVSIDKGLVQFIEQKSEAIHAFTPVKGMPCLREAIAERSKRLLNVCYDPSSEILVSPGGIKGAITVVFQTMLNPGDEVIIPIPNWPHYADMVGLHDGTPVFVKSNGFPGTGLTADALTSAITDKTKFVILGDCINPNGKVYSTEEFEALADIIRTENKRRKELSLTPLYVLYDCPYEAHILQERPTPLPALIKDFVFYVTGPGKTYGMHGDRIGYLCAPAHLISAAEIIQVNMNSFASNYGQIAATYALKPSMDEVAVFRAKTARKNLEHMLGWLSEIPGMEVKYPDGSFFIFVDFSPVAELYGRLGYERADEFLLKEARVATICGAHFAKGFDGADQLNHYVRMNCGRSTEILKSAADRIKHAIVLIKEGEACLPLA